MEDVPHKREEHLQIGPKGERVEKVDLPVRLLEGDLDS